MYIDVITLETAKNHLRVDLDFTADDEAITRMIASALQLIEVNTNHIMYARDINYYLQNGYNYISVFDYPINTTDFGDVTKLDYSLNARFYAHTVMANVGYANVSDVPKPLIEAALMLIENWYYESETDGSKGLDMPLEVQRIIMNYKRCIVV